MRVRGETALLVAFAACILLAIAGYVAQIILAWVKW